MNMVDIDKLIASVLLMLGADKMKEKGSVNIETSDLINALAHQGLMYKDGKIVRIEQDGYEYPLFCRANDAITEFEQCLKSGTNIYVEQGRRMEDWDAKEDAKELLSIARVQDEVSGLILDREDGESNISYLERCLVPKMRYVWYEAAKEIREKEQKKHEVELEQAYKNADEVQYRRGYRKAIEDSIEFIYEQLQEGTIGCGNIEEFIDNYRKMKDDSYG